MVAAVGVIGYASGVTAAGVVFTVLALAAALLRAAFDLCLGGQAYLFVQRNLKRIRPEYAGDRQ